MRTQREFLKEAGRTLYPVDFDLGILDRSHVKVFVDPDHPENELTYTWVNTNQIQLSEPFSADKMFIRRIVPKHELWVDFEDGARLNEKNLDDANRQCLMAVEEVLDGFFDDVYIQKLKDLVAECREEADRAKDEADRAQTAVDDAIEEATGIRDQTAGIRDQTWDYRNQTLGFRNEANSFAQMSGNFAEQLKSFIENYATSVMIFPLDCGFITDPVVTNNFDLGILP